jgi:hypothetical protein
MVGIEKRIARSRDCPHLAIKPPDMGHPIVVFLSNVGHPALKRYQQTKNFHFITVSCYRVNLCSKPAQPKIPFN